MIGGGTCVIFHFTGFQKAPGIKNYFPESSILIVVGLLIGIVLFLADYNQNVVTLTPDIFFLFLLPPIIGEAGYFMPNRLFFDQLGTILLMAVVGTIFNMFTIGEWIIVIFLRAIAFACPCLVRERDRRLIESANKAGLDEEQS